MRDHPASHEVHFVTPNPNATGNLEKHAHACAEREVPDLFVILLLLLVSLSHGLGNT
jgi:hypothetical protein